MPPFLTNDSNGLPSVMDSLNLVRQVNLRLSLVETTVVQYNVTHNNNEQGDFEDY